jgi:hypothetical protein
VCVSGGQCRCEQGYAGAGCELCAAGWLDTRSGTTGRTLGNLSGTDPGGVCVDDPCTPDPCNGHGVCTAPQLGNTSIGTLAGALCSCTVRFDGPACDRCAMADAESGFADYPQCVDPCEPDPCNGHGKCLLGAEVATRTSCRCHDGFQGAACGSCAPGHVGYAAAAPNGDGGGGGGGCSSVVAEVALAADITTIAYGTPAVSPALPPAPSPAAHHAASCALAMCRPLPLKAPAPLLAALHLVLPPQRAAFEASFQRDVAALMSTATSSVRASSLLQAWALSCVRGKGATDRLTG